MPNAAAARKPMPPAAAPAPSAPLSDANPVHRLQALADREMAGLDTLLSAPAVDDRLSPRVALVAIGSLCALAWAIPAVILF